MKKFIFFPKGLDGDFLPFFVNPNPISYFCLDVPLLINNVKNYGSASIVWEQIDGPTIEIQNETSITPTIVFNSEDKGQKITLRLKYIDNPLIYTDVEIDPFVFSPILHEFVTYLKNKSDIYGIRKLDITIPPPEFNKIESFCFNSDSENIYIRWLNPADNNLNQFHSVIVNRNDDGEYNPVSQVGKDDFPGTYTKNNKNHKLFSLYVDKLGNSFVYERKAVRIKNESLLPGVNDLFTHGFTTHLKRQSEPYPFILTISEQAGKSNLVHGAASILSRESQDYPFVASIIERNGSSSFPTGAKSNNLTRNNESYIFINGELNVG